MTAVDDAGNKVVRYRIIDQGFMLRRNIVEITVHPDWRLTEELALALTISAPRLRSYFGRPGGMSRWRSSAARRCRLATGSLVMLIAS